MKSLLDSSVIISALCGGDPDHDACRKVLLAGRHTVLVHAFAETSSTLIGIRSRTLQNWEQSHLRLEDTGRALLRVAITAAIAAKIERALANLKNVLDRLIVQFTAEHPAFAAAYTAARKIVTRGTLMPHRPSFRRLPNRRSNPQRGWRVSCQSVAGCVPPGSPRGCWSFPPQVIKHLLPSPML